MRNEFRFLVAMAALASFGTAARAERVTECTALDICYCVEQSLKSAIDANIGKIRKILGEQRAAGKAIGYMSIPLSTVGGSYFGVNADVATRTKAKIERRFGAAS